MSLTFAHPVPLVPFTTFPRRARPERPLPTPALPSLSLSSPSTTPPPIQLFVPILTTAATSLALLLHPPPTIALPVLPPDLPLLSPSNLPSNLSSSEKNTLRTYSKSHTRLSGSLSQQFSLARRLETSGNLDAARQVYDQLIQDAPDFAPAYSNRANLLAASKQFDRAIADYDASIALAPLDSDSWVVYVNRGCTKLARGDDPRQALADLNVADDLRARNEIVLANRAGVWEVMGKWDNSIRDYQAALRSNDVRPFWCRYALVLFQRGKGDEALAILKRVAARFDAPDVHAALAVLYFEKGDVGLAEGEWTKVERPKSFESRRFLELDRKWPPRAVQVMDRFRRLKE